MLEFKVELTTSPLIKLHLQLRIEPGSFDIQQDMQIWISSTEATEVKINLHYGWAEGFKGNLGVKKKYFYNNSTYPVQRQLKQTRP